MINVPGQRRVVGLAYVILTIGGVSPAYAQFPGLENYKMKAVHNSYLASKPPLNELIDDYNTWSVELDVFWDVDDGIVRVSHYCGAGIHSFDGLLDELLASGELSKRVVFVWLEMKNRGGVCENNEWPCTLEDDGRDRMLPQIEAAFARAGRSLNQVYTPVDFAADADAKGLCHWPSLQNLVDRGKHIIFVADGSQVGPLCNDDNPFFFSVGNSPNKACASMNSRAFVNRQEADIEGSAPSPNDGYLWRSWEVDPLFRDRNHWERQIDRNFNLINCDSETAEWTILDSRTHSPSPLYVVPSYTGDKEWGTISRPFKNIVVAYLRLTPGATLSLKAGTYNLFGLIENIDKPMTLVARDGPVTITNE